MTKVLIVGLFNNLAGTESVVTNYIQFASQSISFDILVHEHLSNYEDVLARPNVKEIIIPSKRKNYIGYRLALGRVIKMGDYDAVWHNAGNITNIDDLVLARRHGIKTRIFHAHNSVFDGTFRDKIISKYHKKVLNKYATDFWACSHSAGSCFFCDQYRIINNAIDMKKYRCLEAARESARKELDVAAEIKVIGTIGRLTLQKNQEWLVKLFGSYFLDENYILLIIGSGELQKDLEELVSSLGLHDQVKLLGQTSRVDYYLSAMDLFVLPSLYEGLPVVLSEAQANDLPCIVSSSVSDESSYIRQNKFIPLSEEKEWVEAIRTTDRKTVSIDEEKRRSYDIDCVAQELSLWWSSLSEDCK